MNYGILEMGNLVIEDDILDFDHCDLQEFLKIASEFPILSTWRLFFGLFFLQGFISRRFGSQNLIQLYFISLNLGSLRFTIALEKPYETHIPWTFFK